MPANITPVSTWTSPLTGPANGDPVDGNAGGPSFDMGQKLANRIEWLKDHVAGTSNELWPLPLAHMPFHSSYTNYWGFDVVTGAYGVMQNDAALARVAWFEVILPAKGTLTTLSVALVGAAGTHAAGAVTFTLPTVTLYRQPTGSAAAATLVATVSDTSATGAAYELVHLVSLTALTEAFAFDAGMRWYLKVAGETGVGSSAGLRVVNLLAEVTP